MNRNVLNSSVLIFNTICGELKINTLWGALFDAEAQLSKTLWKEAEAVTATK